MDKIVTGIFIIGGLLIIFYQSKWYLKKDNNEFMSLENTKAIKGITAILIIMHHILFFKIEVPFLNGMKYIGYLLVGIFFLFSGYGLMKSVKIKENYLKSFITKRIPSIMVPFFLTNIVYLIAEKFFFARNYSIMQTMNYILGIELINTYAWYTIMILVFYIAFYFFFYFFKEKKAVIFMTVFVLFTIIFRMQFEEMQWYVSSVSFVIGMLLAYQQEKIIRWVNKRYLWCLCSVVLGIIVFFLLGFMIQDKSIILRQIVKIVCNSFFTLTVITINMKLQINNKILVFLGRISYEIYLIHKLVLRMMFGYLNTLGPAMYMVLCIALSIMLGYGIHKIDDVIIKVVKKYGQTENKRTKQKILRQGARLKNRKFIKKQKYRKNNCKKFYLKIK